jgi:hypothetical protein
MIFSQEHSTEVLWMSSGPMMRSRAQCVALLLPLDFNGPRHTAWNSSQAGKTWLASLI